MRKAFSWMGVVAALSIFSFIVGVLARFSHLANPNQAVFDEVYFPVFAWDYLHNVQAFDVHPPLGKFILALSMKFLGNTPFAWRLMPALFGCGLIILFGYLWWSYTKDRVISLLLAGLISVETLLIVYSRIGLMDGVLLFFILAAFTAAFHAPSRRALFWAATWVGVAVAIKWIALGVLVPIGYICWRKRSFLFFVISLLWSGFLYTLAVLAGEWVGKVSNLWEQFKWWHSQAFYYHIHLTATHPWGSVWWSWPLMLRPVLLYYNAQGQEIRIIDAMANPLLLWSSSLAVLGSFGYLAFHLYKHKKMLWDHPLVPLLLGYLAFFLPWAFIHRVLFFYHYLPAYAFALLCLAYWMGVAWKRWPEVVLIYVVVMILTGIFYLPLATASPLTRSELMNRLWFEQLLKLNPVLWHWFQVHLDFKSWLY